MKKLLILIAVIAIAAPVFAQGRRSGKRRKFPFREFNTHIPLVEDEAPDFELKDTDGNSNKLSEYRKKMPVVLVFGSGT